MPNFKYLNGYNVYDEDAHNQINAMKGLYDNSNSHTVNINNPTDNLHGTLIYHIYNNVCYMSFYVRINDISTAGDTSSGSFATDYVPFPPYPLITPEIRLSTTNNYNAGQSNQIADVSINAQGALTFNFDFRRMTGNYVDYRGTISYPITGYHASARSKAKTLNDLKVPVEINIITDDTPTE